MSRVYWHSPSARAELRGSERAYAGVLTQDLFLAALGVHDFLFKEEALAWRQILDDPRRLEGFGDGGEARALRLALTSYSEAHLRVEGQEEEVFLLTLNTAWRFGSDAVKLLTRLHGQCELHGWTDGPNRAWLAQIIERGREEGVLRDDQGWEDVTALLRQRSDEPVVLSYSVCEQFPNAYVAGWKDEHDGDDWYELPVEEQWSRAMARLREEESRWLEWRPDHWQDYYFGSGLSAGDVRRELARARIAVDNSRKQDQS